MQEQESNTSGHDAEVFIEQYLTMRDAKRYIHRGAHAPVPKGDSLPSISQLGTVISIPFAHFKQSLRLLEDVPFNLRTFFELTAYLELGVLFDRLAVVPDTWPLNDWLNDIGPTARLLNEDEVLLYLSGDDLTEVTRFRKVFASVSGPSVLSPDIEFGVYFMHALAHRQLKLTFGYHVPFEILNRYLDTVRYEEALRAYSLLLTVYEQLTSSLREEIGGWEDYLSARILFIPPIMTRILSRCSTPRDIPQAFLDVRGELEPVRQYFREYHSLLRAPSSTVGTSLKAISRLEDVIKSLAAKHGDRRTFVISEWQDGLTLLPDADSLEQIDTGAFKFLLGKPLQWLINRVKNRRILPLFHLRDDFYRTKDYPSLVQKVFHTTITSTDLRDTYDVTGAFRRLVRWKGGQS